MRYLKQNTPRPQNNHSELTKKRVILNCIRNFLWCFRKYVSGCLLGWKVFGKCVKEVKWKTVFWLAASSVQKTDPGYWVYNLNYPLDWIEAFILACSTGWKYVLSWSHLATRHEIQFEQDMSFRSRGYLRGCQYRGKVISQASK